MRRASRIPVAATALGLSLIPMAVLDASAQKRPPPIPDAAVRKMIELGLKNIDRAVCDGFNQCTPATPEEFETPPITIDHARAALLAGARTAFAAWCGLDATRRSILPLQRELRRSKQFNGRQLALMAVIHGIQQSIVAGQLKAKGECDAATRSNLDAQLPKS